MTRPLTLTTLLLLVATPAAASPIGFNPYAPTPSTGSWDGPGMTASELLGRPGDIGLAFNFTAYAPIGTVLYSITARPDGKLTQSPYDGSWSYANGYDVFNTKRDPKQFAYWEDETGVTLGVEDLTGPSGWDYNDYVVRFNRLPEPAQFSTVPEPGLWLLIGLAALLHLAATVYRQWRGEMR
jgi:hypothetical protein